MGRIRFGAGVMGGLLLGLAVIGSTGLTALGSFGALSPSAGSSSNMKDSVTVASTAETSSASSTSANGSAIAVPYPPSVSTTTTASASTGQNEASIGFAPSSSAQRVSNLDNILNQAPLVNGLVFLPVLVAFLLGAVLYRASRKSEPEAETEKGDST